MPYDAALADRLREVLSAEPGVSERTMFGGRGFMVAGNMAVAASSSGDLMVRVDPGAAEEWIDGVAVRPMVMRGRAMKGWLLVAVDAVTDAAALTTWVDRGVSQARALPPKPS